MSNSLQNQCIIAIGETGLGKSFTATVFGAKIAKIGHSTEPETDKITFYDIGNGSFYVDTPGFNDSNDATFYKEFVRLTLRVMQDKNISKITTILWFVTYANRATTFLKRQARVIEAFAQDHTGNVWDNTIIVTKGDERGEGPRAAAKEIAKEIYEQKYDCKLDANKDLLTNTGYFEIRLFESLSERKQNFYKKLTSDQMNADNVFKKLEPQQILTQYEILMRGHTNYPIFFKFRKVKCLNCPEETDPRLANAKCHLEQKLVHPGLTAVHSEEAEYFHHSQPIDAEILENLSSTIGPANVYTLEKRWRCCGGKQYSVGCKSQYRCCKRPIGSAGCIKMCNYCKTIPHDCSNSKECKAGKCKVESGCLLACPGCGQSPIINKGCSIAKKHKWSELPNSQGQSSITNKGCSIAKKHKSSKQCILAIGETGLGKSVTATIFGAKNAKVGHSIEPETDKVTFYNIGIGNGDLFVDTPGLTNIGKADNETVRLILREMQDRKISSITTILWFVKYECRKTASLKHQARIIEAFARDHKGNVWDNTIIVTKGDKRGEGARAAADEIAKTVYEQKHKRKPDARRNLLEYTGNFEISLFESLDKREQKFYDSLYNEEMNEDNVFKLSLRGRILIKYEQLMRGHMNYPVALVFGKLKCLKCPEETDPRLANPKCHLKMTKIHFDNDCYKECRSRDCKSRNCELVCLRCKQNPVKDEGCTIEGNHVWSQ